MIITLSLTFETIFRIWFEKGKTRNICCEKENVQQIKESKIATGFGEDKNKG